MNHPDGVININAGDLALTNTGDDIGNMARAFEHEFIHRTPDERASFGALADELGNNPYARGHLWLYQSTFVI
jgi:hypothetical protein